MKKLTQEEFLEKARAVHGNKYDYSECVFTNTRAKVRIICPVHGVFEQNACSHLMGHGCKACGLKEMWCGELGEKRRKTMFTPERIAKMEATCMLKYGAKTFAISKQGRDKIDAIKRTPEFRQRMHDIISSDEVQAKTKLTCQTRYGVDSFMQTDEGRKVMHNAMTPAMMTKIIEKKKQNGTLVTSKPEAKLYDLLCQQFGCENVVRQYQSDVYPFACDFYIRSRNLYIEHNVCWTHGGHWFEENCSADQDKLKQWSQKDSKYYANAIDTWTVRDVSKRKTAAKHNLNYVVFWKANLSDVQDWFNDKCPIRKDWK